VRYLRRLIKGEDAYWKDFSVGNAGDIFAQNLVELFYGGAKAENSDTGPRLLCVGSIAHKAVEGDVICGVGFKEGQNPVADPDKVLVHGVRGPMTEGLLKARGFDTSKIKFYGDPGLTISKMVTPVAAKTAKVIFIPHYRERGRVQSLVPQGIEVVDIDSDPLVLAKQIMEAELVYASSLHGIIFAHALGRPAVPVKPATVEPLSKYEDYYLGVGLQTPKFLDSIADADFLGAPVSPSSLTVKADDIIFPSFEDLQQRGIIT
jgi:hypothetical protein